jgi:large subunit ribosomal protein L22
MQVKAVSRHARISPRKVHKIIGAVKGRPVESGLEILKFMPQKAARILEKTVRSAVANADQNPDVDIDLLIIRNVTADHQNPDVDIDLLIIRNVTADQGPTLKRWRARARGRGTRILKRTSHITVTLAEEGSV